MAFWLALLVPSAMLVFVSIATKRQGSKLGALVALAVLLFLDGPALALALAMVDVHFASWQPAVFALAAGLLGFYLLVIWLSFRPAQVARRADVKR